MKENKNDLKTKIILLVGCLLIGFILGGIVFSKNSLNLSSKDKSTTTNEITILNKEINNCINQLNICENSLKSITENNSD